MKGLVEIGLLIANTTVWVWLLVTVLRVAGVRTTCDVAERSR